MKNAIKTDEQLHCMLLEHTTIVNVINRLKTIKLPPKGCVTINKSYDLVMSDKTFLLPKKTIHLNVEHFSCWDDVTVIYYSYNNNNLIRIIGCGGSHRDPHDYDADYFLREDKSSESFSWLFFCSFNIYNCEDLIIDGVKALLKIRLITKKEFSDIRDLCIYISNHIKYRDEYKDTCRKLSLSKNEIGKLEKRLLVLKQKLKLKR